MVKKTSKDILINSVIHNGIIAKVTSSAVILLVSMELLNSFDCMTNADIVLPVLTGVLATAMTFLFVKRDGKFG